VHTLNLKIKAMQATARIFFQTTHNKRTVKTNLCPVKLCITFENIRKYYSIKHKIKKHSWLFIAPDDIDLYNDLQIRGKFVDMRIEYNRIVEEAESIIKDIDLFSFGQFEELYLNQQGDWKNFASAAIEHIRTLKEEGRFGYASSFDSTLRAVMEYHSKQIFSFPNLMKVEDRYNTYLNCKELRFADITETWLKKFETKLLKTKSRSTIGIYARNIRVLFNIAIKQKKLKVVYPFHSYTPKTAEGRKMALTAHQISLIANYETEHPEEKKYRDFFMFSFLANGLNLADIARIKNSDIKGDEMNIVREKTKNKDKEVKLHFNINSEMERIIKKWRVRSVGHDSYVFPILRPEWSEEQKYAAIKQLTKQTNKYIRQVADAVGINERISTYSARHSWATIAQNSGVSTEFIKEALGHSSVSVTESYLKGFEKDTRKKQSEEMEKLIYKSV
jgi:integrase/recombinase XerD